MSGEGYETERKTDESKVTIRVGKYMLTVPEELHDEFKTKIKVQEEEFARLNRVYMGEEEPRRSERRPTLEYLRDKAEELAGAYEVFIAENTKADRSNIRELTPADRERLAVQAAEAAEAAAAAGMRADDGRSSPAPRSGGGRGSGRGA